MQQTRSQKRLKILFITPWYPTNVNPVNGIFVQEHAKAVQLFADVFVLHFAGHSPTLNVGLSFKEVEDPKLTAGIKTYRLQYRSAASRVMAHFKRGWSFIQAFRTLRRQGIRPDVIHAHVHSVSLPAIMLGRLFRIPVVISEHHSAFPLKSLSNRQVKEARFAFRRAARVMPVSKALQKGIEENRVTARFTIIPNVVDMDLFQPPTASTRGRNGGVHFLCVGMMPESEVKGIPYLLEALAILRTTSHLDWRVTFVGDGPLRQTYEEKALKLQLNDLVKFVGSQPKLEVSRLMQQADVFVLPSVWDNMPCVIIEAMASGLPVVSTQVGGIPEMVHDESGILVPPRDAKALAAALVEMINNHEHKYSRATIAQHACERYSQQAVGEKLFTIYCESIDESIY